MSVISVKSTIARKVATIEENVVTEYITITATNVTDQEIELLKGPSNPSDVVLDIIGGSSQINGDDFYVQGNFIKYDSRPLETILEVGDAVRVIYYI